jgi:hypothetical protein
MVRSSARVPGPDTRRKSVRTTRAGPLRVALAISTAAQTIPRRNCELQGREPAAVGEVWNLMSPST